jgi:hypothetical protein
MRNWQWHIKHRPAADTRRVPIPPELVAILLAHIDTFGSAAWSASPDRERGGAR